MLELMPRDAEVEGAYEYVQSKVNVELWKAYRLPSMSPAYSCAGLVPMARAPMSAPVVVVRVVAPTVPEDEISTREIEPERQPMKM